MKDTRITFSSSAIVVAAFLLGMIVATGLLFKVNGGFVDDITAMQLAKVYRDDHLVEAVCVEDAELCDIGSFISIDGVIYSIVGSDRQSGIEGVFTVIGPGGIQLVDGADDRAKWAVGPWSPEWIQVAWEYRQQFSR